MPARKQRDAGKWKQRGDGERALNDAVLVCLFTCLFITYLCIYCSRFSLTFPCVRVVVGWNIAAIHHSSRAYKCPRLSIPLRFPIRRILTRSPPGRGAAELSWFLVASRDVTILVMSNNGQNIAPKKEGSRQRKRRWWKRYGIWPLWRHQGTRYMFDTLSSKLSVTCGLGYRANIALPSLFFFKARAIRTLYTPPSVGKIFRWFSGMSRIPGVPLFEMMTTWCRARAYCIMSKKLLKYFSSLHFGSILP